MPIAAAWVYTMFTIQPAMAFDPDAPNSGMAPVAPIPAGLPAAPAAAPTGPQTTELPPNLKPTSLFISPNEMGRINEALAAYKRARESALKSAEDKAKNFLNQLEEEVQVAPEPPKPVSFTYPQFYLESLSFRNANDWMVQINGHKFGPHIPQGDYWLKIVMVDKEMVVVEWLPKDMSKVQDSWMLVPPDDAQQSEVLVDSIRDTVTFTLRPNQTFSSFAMRVVEGKVMPVTITTMESQPVVVAVGTPTATAPVASAPAATATAPPASADDKKEGVKALNETYKRIGLE